MVALTRLRSNHDEKHIEAMLEIIPSGGVCIEGGAHRGLWTTKLEAHFDYVYAFEPNAEHVKELRKVVDPAFTQVYSMALADDNKYWELEPQPGATNDGQYRLVPITNPTKPYPRVFSVRIDDHYWRQVSFIKLDIEGAEHLAIRGGLQTIMRCKPFVMVEQNELSEVNFNVSKTLSGELLEELGMVEVGRWNKDVLYGWGS